MTKLDKTEHLTPKLHEAALRFWLSMYPGYEDLQRQHEAFATFCDLLQVDPEGAQTWKAFRRWKLLCRYEQLADEIIEAEKSGDNSGSP